MMSSKPDRRNTLAGEEEEADEEKGGWRRRTRAAARAATRGVLRSGWKRIADGAEEEDERRCENLAGFSRVFFFVATQLILKLLSRISLIPTMYLKCTVS